MRTGALRRWRRATRTPFSSRGQSTKIVHCAHHKVGTVWFRGILAQLAQECGLQFAVKREGNEKHDADIVFYPHAARFDPSLIVGSYVGSHMIRDPRDVVVSAYFYHLWTTESWAHEPRADLAGKSYQEHLNGVPEHDGLLAEIGNSWLVIREMLSWDYRQPEFHEMRYENLLADEEREFERLFRAYGFDDRGVRRGLAITRRHSFQATSKRRLGQVSRGQHLRSGRPGEWRELFSPAHIELFKRITGDAVVVLGYERDNEWH